MKLLLGRQAILDREKNLAAYELLFRNLDNTPICSDTEATASVLSTALNMFGTESILGNKRGFINIGIDLLRKDLLDILPPKKYVIEILETQTPSPELIQLIRHLKTKGYIFALDDFVINDENLIYWRPVLQEVQIVKVDVLETTEENLKTKTEILAAYHVALLAEKVETTEMFDLCYDLGFHYFQGYFFTKPSLIEGTGFDTNTQGIIQIIKLLKQDVEIEDIEKILKNHPDLIISLLKLANSASVSPIQEITSIRQTIALLGKRALSQWLLLMLYSKKLSESQTTNSNPLFLLAAQRGKMMELIIRSHAGGKISRTLADESFLTGLLSLSDTLLHVPLKMILEEIHVSKGISDALLFNKGHLGSALMIVKMLEQNQINNIYDLVRDFNMDVASINKISVDSMSYSHEFAKAF